MKQFRSKYVALPWDAAGIIKILKLGHINMCHRRTGIVMWPVGYLESAFRENGTLSFMQYLFLLSISYHLRPKAKQCIPFFSGLLFSRRFYFNMNEKIYICMIVRKHFHISLDVDFLEKVLSYSKHDWIDLLGVHIIRIKI